MNVANCGLKFLEIQGDPMDGGGQGGISSLIYDITQNVQALCGKCQASMKSYGF